MPKSAFLLSEVEGCTDQSAHSGAGDTSARVSSFFWVQSMVRDDGQRTLLFDLDTAIQRIAGSASAQTAGIKELSVQLTGVYHNLLRQGAEM